MSIGTLIGMTRRGPFVLQRVPAGEGGLQPADACREVDGEPLGLDIGAAGIRPRLLGGDECELRRRVEPVGHRALEHRVRTDEGLGREGHGELVLLDPVVVERVGAGCPGQQGRPGVGARCRRSGWTRRSR